MHPPYRIHKIVILEQDFQQVSQHALWVCPSFRAKQEKAKVIYSYYFYIQDITRQ